jgi:hypothetical protein
MIFGSLKPKIYIFPTCTKISDKIIKTNFISDELGRPGLLARPSQRAACLGAPPARATLTGGPPQSGTEGQGRRRPASSDELELAGEELAQPSELHLVFSVTRCVDWCSWNGWGWGGRGLPPRAAAGDVRWRRAVAGEDARCGLGSVRASPQLGGSILLRREDGERPEAPRPR